MAVKACSGRNAGVLQPDTPDPCLRWRILENHIIAGHISRHTGVVVLIKIAVQGGIAGKTVWQAANYPGVGAGNPANTLVYEVVAIIVLVVTNFRRTGINGRIAVVAVIIDIYEFGGGVIIGRPKALDKKIAIGVVVAVSVYIPDLAGAFERVVVVAVVVGAKEFCGDEVVGRATALYEACAVGVIVAVEVAEPGLAGPFERIVVVAVVVGAQQFGSDKIIVRSQAGCYGGAVGVVVAVEVAEPDLAREFEGVVVVAVGVIVYISGRRGTGFNASAAATEAVAVVVEEIFNFGQHASADDFFKDKAGFRGFV